MRGVGEILEEIGILSNYATNLIEDEDAVIAIFNQIAVLTGFVLRNTEDCAWIIKWTIDWRNGTDNNRPSQIWTKRLQEEQDKHKLLEGAKDERISGSV
jgi:hypothetical protein